MGVKGSSYILECNRSHYDIFYVACVNGTFHIQGANGKYMGLDGDSNVIISADKPRDFYFELRAHTHMIIRDASSGRLLKGAQNGGFTATGSDISSATLWEY